MTMKGILGLGCQTYQEEAKLDAIQNLLFEKYAGISHYVGLSLASQYFLYFLNMQTLLFKQCVSYVIMHMDLK